MQANVQSLVDGLGYKTNKNKILEGPELASQAVIRFMELHLQLSETLKLHTQAAPERAQSGNQRDVSIPGIRWHIPLCQKVVAVRDGFPAPEGESWQGLPNADVQIGIDLVEGLTVEIHARNRRAAEPFVTGFQPRARARNPCRDRRTERMARLGAQDVAEQAVAVVRRGERAGESINR